MKKIFAATTVISCIAALLAGCSTQVATVVSHDEDGGRAVSVSARGAWPFQGYDDVQSEVQDAVREACDFVFLVPDESSDAARLMHLHSSWGAIADIIKGPSAGVIAAVGESAAKLIDETPVHTLQWAGGCEDLFVRIPSANPPSQN